MNLPSFKSAYDSLSMLSVSQGLLTNLNNIAYKRIKAISWLVVITYAALLYFGFVMMGDVADQTYLFVLRSFHFLVFVLSALFLLFHYYRKKRAIILSPKTLNNIVHFYAAFYAAVGSVSSINSQRLTGNIDSYVIIILTIGAFLPLKFRNISIILMVNHLLFLAGLFLYAENQYEFLTKAFNSTAALVYALLLAGGIFLYIKRDYTHVGKLKENEQNFRKMFEVNPYPLILTSFEGKPILTNKKASLYFQSLIEDIHLLGTLSIYNDPSEREHLIREVKERGSVQRTLELKGSDGRTVWALIFCEKVIYGDQECILTGITDITHMKQLENELVQNASIDSLTGLMNRKYGLNHLQLEIDRADHSNSTMVIGFIDINKLKMVNDRYGHLEGDRLIKSICQSIQEVMHEEDLFFRYGGDEFVLVFLNKDLFGAERIWKQAEQKFAELNHRDHRPYKVSASIGYFQYEPNSQLTIEQMLKYADDAMYKNKTASYESLNK
ncbi:GGDEF domain-containing protein [Cytobacillus gottheilii]|uniref:GGDEF domain-containing protein n=1 Tax=Cytobacillus gottheilii TaxID=859144 RepID=UPI00082B93C4|nr:sensor domain-containing diguanylate cyclase [Cytobacillus gottheilii]